tara:strand:+ start:7 stop:564 length:558 start_codon:yes stop_codon:yes gene_type:complete
MKVSVNDFVRRQVKGSGKTYSIILSFEEIASYAEEQMVKGNFNNGYRDGVRIVNADSSIVKYFICPLVKIDEKSKLVSNVIKRRPSELAYIQTGAIEGSLEEPGEVQFILYSHKVLKENNENSSDSEWELICINSFPKGIKELPMKPITMMRNQLELPGGTKAFYSSDEWAKSIYFWQKYVPLLP